MQTTSMLSSERLDNILLFHRMDSRLSKSERRGPKGNEAFRYIASAEIIDLENEIINLDAIAEVMPIMKEQGARTSVDHMNFPAGEFFDWGFTTAEGVPAIWLDLEVYEKYPNQKETLRRIKLPPEDPESLTCISLGGFKLEKHRECGDLTCWTRITKIEGWEFSHVHRGANQLALKVEEQLDHMEFESLNKEQPRDSTGQFVSEIISTTITKYSESNHNKTKTPCDKKLEKGDKDKEYKEDKNLEEEQELEEEVVENADEEQASEDLAGEEELNEEPMGDDVMEDGFEEDPRDQIADRELIVDTNERVKVIMSAMNIDKSDKVAFEVIKETVTLLDEHLNKNQGEKEMTDNEITVNGVVYVAKPDAEKPEIGKSDPEKTESVTFTKDEVQALITEELKKFGENIAKTKDEEEVIVTDNTQNPIEHDAGQVPEDDGPFNKTMSPEDRFMNIGSLRKEAPLTVFEQ